LIPRILDPKCEEGKELADLYDSVFWAGDLNYRINGTRRIIDSLLLKNMHEVMLNNDQLSIARKSDGIFRGYSEGPVNFRPTYKFDKGCVQYDTSRKNRIPSWTDRILYKENGETKLKLYNSNVTMNTSDHLPVYAVFENKIKFGSEETKVSANVKYGETVSEVCVLQ
jgi:hypothetical protein